jgi:dolichyl-phosphate beta-glucosyltransferase
MPFSSLSSPSTPFVTDPFVEALSSAPEKREISMQSSLTSTPLLSIIIPAYNEEERLPETLAHVVEYLNQQPYRAEIIVVSDGSTDTTVALVKKWQIEVPYLILIDVPENQGKGFCLKEGFTVAKGAYALMYDADKAVPIDTLDQWLTPTLLLSDSLIVIGSRNIKTEGVVRRFNPFRRLASVVFQKLTRLVAADIEDTQCGFKLFPQRAYHLFVDLQQEKGFAADLEYLTIAYAHGFEIEERGVSWTNMAGSKVRVLQDSWRLFCAVFRIKYAHWQGYYR